MEKPRRAPAVFKKVGNITEDDIRIRLVGEVTDKKENSIILRDETGKIKVEGDRYTGGELVRVFGRPMRTQKGMILEAEMVQNMDSLNKRIYKRWEQQNNRRFV